MMDIGRVAIKVAGRNSRETVVIVDKIDENFVIIDGNVKRKRCNVRHLEPLANVLNIKKGASTKEVHEAMKKEGFAVKIKKKTETSKAEAQQKKKNVKRKPGK